MRVDQKTSLMTFIIGSKNKLFQTRAFYKCYCGDQFELFSLKKKRECTCGKEILPIENKDRIFLYFNLTEEPEKCPWEENELESQLDYLLNEDYDSINFTMAGLDEIAGPGTSDSLLSLLQIRTETLKNFIERDNLS